MFGMDIGSLFVEIPKAYSAWINDATGGNEFLAGTLGIAVLGGASYILRSIPTAIYQAIQRKIIFSVTVDNTDDGYLALLSQLDTHSGNYGSRDFSLIPEEDDEERSDNMMHCYKLGSGQGFHFFFFRWRLFWYTIQDLDSTGVGLQKKRIVLKTFGVHKSVIEDFIRSLRKPRPREGIVGFFTFEGNSGEYIGHFKPQSINDICLDDQIRNCIMRILDDFHNKKEETIALGIPHKLVLMIHGEPGNGKSKLIPAIARYLRKDINNININSLSSISSLQHSIRSKSNVHVLEDIHSLAALAKKRAGVSYVKTDKPIPNPNIEPPLAPNMPMEESNWSAIDLSEFLNALNGSVPLDGQIIIMTTNYIDDLDQAILRPGRTDYVLNLPRIKKDTVNEWLGRKLPGFDMSRGFTKSVRGCDIGGLLQTTYGDLEKVYEQIPLIEKKIPYEQGFYFNDANSVEFD